MSGSPKEIINEVFVRSLFCEPVYVTSVNLFSSTLCEFTNPDHRIWLLALIFFIFLLLYLQRLPYLRMIGTMSQC